MLRESKIVLTFKNWYVFPCPYKYIILIGKIVKLLVRKG